MNQTITRDELKQRLDNGEPVTLVEALPRRYFDAEHLPGAINLPHDEVRERARQLLPDTGATIVVYCASTECRNSALAAEALTDLGYRNVLEYVEGKQDWKLAGFPLERAAA